jgi:hypothetical protein
MSLKAASNLQNELLFFTICRTFQSNEIPVYKSESLKKNKDNVFKWGRVISNTDLLSQNRDELNPIHIKIF